MKKMYSVLALLLCLCMLASCGEGIFDPFSTAETTTADPNDPATPPSDPDSLVLVSNGKSDYRIVYSMVGTSFEIAAAKTLQTMIEESTGVKIPMVDDFEDEGDPTTLRQDREIVVGSATTRTDAYTAPEERFLKGYSVFSDGERLIFEAGSAQGMKIAVRNFAMEYFNGYDPYLIDFDTMPEEKSTVSVKKSYKDFEVFQNVLFPYLDGLTQEELNTACLVHDGAYLHKRLTHLLQKEIKAATGLMLPIGVNEVVAGKKFAIRLTDDSSCKSGCWKIGYSAERGVELKATDYYGFVAATRDLASSWEKYDCFAFDTDASNSYLDTLKSFEQSCAYAYNQKGEYRLMFYNVLWMEKNPSERDYLNAEMIKQYMPDVLGCQEFDISRRGEVKNSDGKGGLVAKLAELGYAEAVDPRVRNAYNVNKTIPGTDASLTVKDAAAGTPLAGYGINGASQVTVGSETYYTYYNCTPLFYNTNTTKIVTDEHGKELAGYYWYKNQVDRITGAAHSCGDQDCGSKAATWGVFESLETGERYIVISTHMCTRSDYIKGLQAQELVALINELVADNDYPVFLGGDYNARYDQPNYLYFTKDAGYIDIERNDLPTDYNSKVKSYHRDYPVYDWTLGFYRPADNDDSGMIAPDESVDHIVLANAELADVNFNVYGVIVDECTISGSDHFPIMLDFTLK